MVRLYINKDFRYTFLREFASMQEAVAYLTRLEMGKEPEIPENYDIVAWEDEQLGAQWTGEWGPFLHTPDAAAEAARYHVADAAEVVHPVADAAHAAGEQ